MIHASELRHYMGTLRQLAREDTATLRWVRDQARSISLDSGFADEVAMHVAITADVLLKLKPGVLEAVSRELAESR